MSTTRRMVSITVVAFFALAGTAYALTVDPTGGPPDSSYTVEVTCDSEPTVRVFHLRAEPQATVPPVDGTESSPGTWLYAVQAGDVDDLVTADCGSSREQFRYDVDAPALFPGPTVVGWGGWDPLRPATQVIGTDCPDGTTASVTFTGADGFTATQTAPIDGYGNWDVPIPAAAPTGDLTVDASCGSVHFDAITIRHTGSTPPDDTGPTATTPGDSEPDASTPSTPSPPAATPVAVSPSYTG